MAPGDVAHVPRTPSPVAEAGLISEHFRSRARLRRLLVRLRRPTLHRPRLRATPGGLRSLRSASSLPFLVTCRRQVIPSHSFAARTRACCAPRKRFWRPAFACLYQSSRDPEGGGARPRHRALPVGFRGHLGREGEIPLFFRRRLEKMKKRSIVKASFPVGKATAGIRTVAATWWRHHKRVSRRRRNQGVV